MDRDNINSSFRDDRGRFVKGFKTKDLPIEYKIKKMYAMEDTWKKDDRYIADLRNQHPRIYNSWRSILYSQKGKKAGVSDDWKSFKNFYNDVVHTYKKGLVFRRLDTTKPFNKDNFMWCTQEEANQLQSNLVWLEYDGELLTLKQLARKYNVSLQGLRIRYFERNKKNYSTEEIIFGRKKKRNAKQCKDIRDKGVSIRVKASKMISSYKHKDRKMGVSVCDIDIDWMISNILTQKCVYCGDTHRVGCDRIDNAKGHTKDNVVPCCYECNTMRNNLFSFDEMKILGEVVASIKANRAKATN